MTDNSNQNNTSVLVESPSSFEEDQSNLDMAKFLNWFAIHHIEQGDPTLISKAVIEKSRERVFKVI